MLHEIGIIGAGISGIYCLKYCLENGIDDIIAFEKDTNIGGVWQYNELRDGGVLKNTYSTSSKFYMHPSDLPYGDAVPWFPKHDIVYNHYLNYVTKFNLRKYIKFNETVNNLEKINNIWELTTSDSKIYYFKNIIIANGSSQTPVKPPCIYSNFRGQLLHSHYFNDKQYKNKRILIVGGGETASDLSEQLSNDNKVFMSIRNGQWFQDRIFGADSPTDMLYNRFVHNCFPKAVINKIIGNLNVENFWGDRGSGIDIWQTKSGFLNSFYNKSRDVIQSIAQGKIVPKNAIVNIEGNNIHFEDGSIEFVDIIILAIGYKMNMPFLKDNFNFNYLHIYDPIDTSIVLCGFIRPFVSSIPMLAEFQAEHIALHFAKKICLPTYDKMIKDINKSKVKQLREFEKDSIRLSRIVDPYDYSSKITKLSKTKPCLFYVFITNPYLWFQLFFNPYSLFSFRIYSSNIQRKQIALEQIKKDHDHNIAVRARTVSLQLFILITFISSFILLPIMYIIGNYETIYQYIHY